MGRKKVEQTMVSPPAEPQAQEEHLPVLAELEIQDNQVGEETEPVVPTMSEPTWHDFVMSHFVEGEASKEGAPYVHGLRRLVTKLLGPIIESSCRTLAWPIQTPQGLTPVTVEHTVKIRWRDCSDDIRVFTEVADVHANNTEAEYLRFPCAMASTRAEARCLRKALQLKKVAAEELAACPLDHLDNATHITSDQLTWIDNICKKMNINAISFINSGKARYNRPEDIPFETAPKMLEKLSDMMNKNKVPPELSGYEAGWRN